VEGRGTSPLLEQDREFVAAVREGREAGPNGASVLPAMRLLQGAQDQIDAAGKQPRDRSE
jgi:hypothetical protein